VLYDSLAGTPAFEALVAASDHGAVVVGTSGSAQIMGSVAVNPYGDDGVETEPTLAWLAGVAVSTHHRDTAEEVTNLRRWLWPAIKTGVVLLVPEAGAVWVHPGWRQFEQLDPGTHGTGAKWWTGADVAPVPLGSHREAPPENAPPPAGAQEPLPLDVTPTSVRRGVGGRHRPDPWSSRYRGLPLTS
jgi:hypothetical protein